MSVLETMKVRETEATDGTLRFEAAPAPSREERQETVQPLRAGDEVACSA